MISRSCLPPRLFLALWLILYGMVASAEDSSWRAPLEVEGAHTITAAEAQELHATGVPFIDVRNPRLFARRHIPGANHLDLKNAFTEAALNAIVARKDQPLVIYCSGLKCLRSSRASGMALSWGYTQVHYFRGGIVEWRKAGLAVESSG